jgi:hypothetical protein
MPASTAPTPSRQKLQRAKSALRQLTARFPQKDDAYEILLGLGDAAISDAAIDRHVILSGTAMLEKMLENTILKHFRSYMDETERKRIFIATMATLAFFQHSTLALFSRER